MFGPNGVSAARHVTLNNQRSSVKTAIYDDYTGYFCAGAGHTPKKGENTNGVLGVIQGPYFIPPRHCRREGTDLTLCGTPCCPIKGFLVAFNFLHCILY